MKTVNPLTDIVTACGNVLRGVVEVRNEQFTIETDGKTWLNIIDRESRVECCIIDGDGDVISETGEYVTESWSSGDWGMLTVAVNAKLENNR